MTADAACIDSVGFVKSVSDADVLRDVTVSQPDIPEFLLRSVVHRPPHNGHQCHITKGCTPFDLQLELTAVVRLMTGFTQCDEVIRGVPARLTGFDMMYIENLVTRLAVTVLTGVSVPEQNVFPNVPEAELFSFLILSSGDVWVFEQLSVELCNFDDGLCHREDCVYFPDECEV